MVSKRILQFGPTAFAIVAFAVVLLWAALTGMPEKVRAPLYAIAAATGLVMSQLPRPAHVRDTWLDRSILGATAASATFSAFYWLLSAEAGTATGVAGGVWVIAVAYFVFWHVSEQQPKDEAPVSKADEAD